MRGLGHGLRLCQCVLQGIGRLAGQHRQGVPGFGNAGLQRGQLGTGLCAGGAGLFDFQRGGQTGLGAPVGDLQGLVLAGEVGACDGQLGLLATQLDVGQSHLGRHRYLCIGQRCLCGLRIGFGGVQRTVLAAKDIGLPTGIQPGFEGVAGRVVARLVALGGPGGGHAGQQACAFDVAQGPGLLQCRLCRTDAGVGLQCLSHKGGEQWVVEVLPPLREFSGFVRVAGRCCNRPGGRDRHGWCVALCLWFSGRRAAGQHNGQRQPKTDGMGLAWGQAPGAGGIGEHGGSCSSGFVG